MRLERIYAFSVIELYDKVNFCKNKTIPTRLLLSDCNTEVNIDTMQLILLDIGFKSYSATKTVNSFLIIQNVYNEQWLHGSFISFY